MMNMLFILWHSGQFTLWAVPAGNHCSVIHQNKAMNTTTVLPHRYISYRWYGMFREQIQTNLLPKHPIQYRSKVSWQFLEPRSSSLETLSSIISSIESWVSRTESRVLSLELWVEKVNELVAWLIAREINCTNGPQTKYVYMQTTSLASNRSTHFGIRKQIITKLHATNSIVNTDKGTRVFSCDWLC